jgi:predicted RNA binding protein YcfA (HicA-like mRNA interferase family)
MPKLPTVNGPEAIRVFESLGWRITRITGSHYILARDGIPVRLSVPVHGNKALKPGTLRSLIRDSGLTVEAFAERLT